jgi:3-oxoacyl-[acyl-carrier-protein] synthase II
VLGEGSGIFVLESEEHALRRGAPILVELAGVGFSNDAFDDAAPDAQGQSLAMRNAMKDAGLSPEDFQYVNAHGTSTELNDAVETKAIKIAFGEHARKLAISSNKSMIGHLSAGAGAVESAATVMTILNGIIPPTINYETPDPECDLDYVPNKARQAKIEAAMSNSFGLGGQNVCLAFKAYN